MTTDSETKKPVTAQVPAADSHDHDHDHEAHGHVHGPGCNHHHHKSEPFVRTQAKVGRNDPCPCGSGKKAKKCCGA